MSGETKSRSIAAIRMIIRIPPRYSARVNCQPSSTQSTSPLYPLARDPGLHYRGDREAEH